MSIWQSKESACSVARSTLVVGFNGVEAEVLLVGGYSTGASTRKYNESRCTRLSAFHWLVAVMVGYVEVTEGCFCGGGDCGRDCLAKTAGLIAVAAQVCKEQVEVQNDCCQTESSGVPIGVFYRDNSSTAASKRGMLNPSPGSTFSLARLRFSKMQADFALFQKCATNFLAFSINACCKSLELISIERSEIKLRTGSEEHPKFDCCN